MVLYEPDFVRGALDDGDVRELGPAAKLAIEGLMGFETGVGADDDAEGRSGGAKKGLVDGTRIEEVHKEVTYQ